MACDPRGVVRPLRDPAHEPRTRRRAVRLGAGRLRADRLGAGRLRAGAIAATAAAVLGQLAGCGSPAPLAVTDAVTPSPTSTADPIEQCAAQLEYWIKEALAGAPDRGYDYQEMGLSGAKYEALTAILDRADTAPTSATEAASWAHEQALAACVEVAARPTPTGSRAGWP